MQRLYHTYYSQYELYTVLKRRHGECIYYHRVTMELKRKQSVKLDLLLRQQFTPNYKEALHLKLNASTVIAPTSNLWHWKDNKALKLEIKATKQFERKCKHCYLHLPLNSCLSYQPGLCCLEFFLKTRVDINCLLFDFALFIRCTFSFRQGTF